MRIRKMTATFGKLDHAVLELKPGLNIIEAPNEWGKSTWCAFLLAMLYGLDTRAKSTKTALADKERYAPWSGMPMAGRIDLSWQNRNITIERTTRGRTPMGVFRAYETDSGLEIPELTAANCGALLLGVEQSVFRRAGFIRQSDMPVTQDEALRRRLNDLVTTGDETGDGDRLAKELKELKNKCRYNRTGLLPQTEAEQAALEETLSEWDSLDSHSKRLKQRLSEEKIWLHQLENHKTALNWRAAEADAARVAEARDNRDRAEAAFAAAETACADLPSRESAEEKLQQLQQLQNQWNDLQIQQSQLPLMPESPVLPASFGEDRVEVLEGMLDQDICRFEQLRKKGIWLIPALLAAVFLGLGVFFAAGRQVLFAGGCFAAALLLLMFGLWKQRSRKKQRLELERKYGSPNPELWKKALEDYLQSLARQDRANREYREKKADLELRQEVLKKQQQALCGGQPLQEVLSLWQQVLQRREQYDHAQREYQHAEKYLLALQSMVKPVGRPAMEDNLTYSMEDTCRLMADARVEQQRLQNRLGQYQGRMEALGDRDALCAQLQALQQRTEKLEQTYRAASLGLETLARARQELQRRFAPRISKRAQHLLSHMTAGRYDRLSLSENFSLLAGAEEENTLHEALWRSDGTVDQLYFALRLAVAEELTPAAPLVLDDAFVRFDDARLKAALEIIAREAQEKQIILFTCQSREKELIS